ncbi:MAG: hypothetical protein AAGF24_06210 [Cyanobacteria bacterium P01_H01_bin.121]
MEELQAQIDEIKQRQHQYEQSVAQLRTEDERITARQTFMEEQMQLMMAVQSDLQQAQLRLLESTTELRESTGRTRQAAEANAGRIDSLLDVAEQILGIASDHEGRLRRLEPNPDPDDN